MREEESLIAIRKRLKQLTIFFFLFAFLLVLRDLNLVLGFTYSIHGTQATMVSFSLIMSGGVFLFFLYNYLQKLSSNLGTALEQISFEWSSATIINKLMIVSGFFSLASSVGSIFDWLGRVGIYVWNLLQIPM